jgi:hypothetical protein
VKRRGREREEKKKGKKIIEGGNIVCLCSLPPM